MKKYSEMTEAEQWLIATITGSLLRDNPNAFNETAEQLSPEDVKIFVVDKDVTELAIEEICNSVQSSLDATKEQAYKNGQENALFSISEKIRCFIYDEE